MGRDTKARRHRDQAVGILSSSRGCPVQASLRRGFSWMDGHALQFSPAAKISSPNALGTESASTNLVSSTSFFQRLSSASEFRKHRVSHDPRIRAGTSSNQHGLCVYRYVVVPEHVHLLLNEPERGMLAEAMQSLKQGRCAQDGLTGGGPVLACPLPRFQCSERVQDRGKAWLHTP
jgi:hypothetical protein